MKDEGIKIPAVFQSSINGSGGGTKEIKKTADISQMIQKLRKIVADLGPFGILSVIAAVFIFTTLFNGSFENNSGKTTTNVLETKHQEQINTLFASIEGVTLERILHLQQSSLQIKQILFQMELLLCIAECSKHLMMSRTQSVCYLMYQSIKYHY